MKTSKKIIVSIIIVLGIIASFFAGSSMRANEYANDRLQRCSTLISFAIDKAENGDLADQGTMKALISNVYAAYQFCDDTKSANQLHDLWNYLIFEGDGSNDTQEIALRELHAVLNAIKTADR